MQMPSWKTVSQFEQSSALVLVAIGLVGFLIDLLVEPISTAGLVLLLLAATPALVATLRQARSPRVAQEDRAGTAREAAEDRARFTSARSAVPDSARAAPVHARQGDRDKVAPAQARLGGETRAPEPSRPSGTRSAAPQPQHDQQRLPLPGRQQRPSEADEPARQRAEPAPARRPGDLGRNSPNVL